MLLKHFDCLRQYQLAVNSLSGDKSDLTGHGIKLVKPFEHSALAVCQ